MIIIFWYEVNITTANEAVEAVADYLGNLGASGVTIENPFDILSQLKKEGSLDFADQKYLDSMGQDVLIKAYFKEEDNMDKIVKELETKLKDISEYLDVGKNKVESKIVDDKDWENEWKKYFKTFDLTEKIIIKPSWETFENVDKKIVVELDPGMAFGTGTHETTKMCAMLVEKYINQNDKFMDIGCGTGILSIIAAKLGASNVVAFDVDSVAVKVATENIEKNNVQKSIKLSCTELKNIAKSKYDIIVANIIADVIVSISDNIGEYLNKEGSIIVSGIIRERKNQVIGEYINRGFKKVDELNYGEWVAMVFKCQDFS